jgi:hypothetical protein
MIENLKDLILQILDAATPTLPEASDWKSPFSFIESQQELFKAIGLILAYVLALAASFIYMLTFCVWSLLNVPVASYRLFKAKKVEA